LQQAHPAAVEAGAQNSQGDIRHDD
jgi:hypothetical protein